MATTTTNFGWDIPQSTDLVKDGATAIAALGQDIDTAFIDLKGGTTGQVLAKASGTDLDFSWVAQDDSNAIQNAIVDAKGDLIGASAADTPARVAVGTNGQVLTADSTAATGLAWTTPTSGGGMTLLSTTALSGSSTTISISPSGYNALKIVISGVNLSANASLRMALNGVTNLTDTAMNYWGPSGAAVGDLSWYWNSYITMKSANTNNVFQITVDDPASTTKFKALDYSGGLIESGGGKYAINGGGSFGSTTDISSAVFTPSTGTFSGGTVLIYGVK
jgi:hypothetical protein